MEEKFKQALITCSDEAQKLGAMGLKRLLTQAERYGAVQAVKEYLRRGRVSDNFDDLADKKLLRLSVEALVCGKQFGQLFTDEEADFCLQALLEAGFYG